MIIKKCKRHGMTRHTKRKDRPNTFRCNKCVGDAVSDRRRKIKVDAVKLLGEKCSICGYNKCISALEFHHKNINEKEITISHTGKSWKRIKEELNKCILLCANCHREIHYIDL